MSEDTILIMIEALFIIFFSVAIILFIRWHVRFDKALKKKIRERRKAEAKGEIR